MKRLLAAAAFAPLCFAAQQAVAQTTISTVTTAPLATSTAGNIEITASGSVAVNGGGDAVTINSDNTLKVDGAVSVRDTPGGTAVMVTTPAGGRTSSITINGNIAADDTKSNTDTDRDGDLDGPFVADGVIRNGIKVVGPGPFIGNITQNSGTIAVEGNGGSSGVSIETGLTGNLSLKGTIGVLGTDTYGVRVRGPVDGAVSIGGVVNVQGERGVGVLLEGPVTGAVRIDGDVTTTGFRYSDQTVLPVEQSKLDADDKLIGGVAVRLMGSMAKGLVLDAPPLETDATDNDEDDDGVEDANEGSSSIRSFGTAPALLVGHNANAVTIGETGAGDFPTFGIQIHGEVIGNGAFDGFAGTAARIGGLGGTVDVAGGMHVRGRINGVAFKADATGLIIGSGTTVPFLVVDGGLISGGVESATGFAPNARAIVIEQGANMERLFNTGTIRAGVTGPAGLAVAVSDQSGTLKTITNLGTIAAVINTSDIDTAPIGSRTAFDLRANTSGVTLTQQTNGDPDFIPTITGDILFGSGNDFFGVGFGRTSGALDFGGGDDAFLLMSGGTSRMDLRKSSGELYFGVGGDLTFLNTTRVNATSLGLTSSGLITFTADPKNADPTRRATFLNVAGDATLEAGSRVDVEFISKLTGPTTFEVLRAGQLVNRGVNLALVNDLPYIFTGAARLTGNSILMDVRPRSTGELGFESGRAAAYDAFYAAFDADPGVARAVFDKKTQQDFENLFDQFLPDYSGGPFNGLANGARAVFQAQAEEVRDMVPGEPRSWLQEVGIGTKFESVKDIEYQTGGFGVAGGIEKPIGDGNQAYGFSGAFISSEIRNANRALGSLLSGSALMSSVYWRAQEGAMTVDASASGAYSWFESNRRVVDQTPAGVQNLIRQANADWRGGMAAARVGVAYNWEAGRFYVKHDAVLDAVYLREGGYTETGGGAAVNLRVAERDTYEVAAEAGLLLGARFGRTFRWGPEIRVAYRGQLDGGEGETVGRFASMPDQPFILPGLIKDRQRIVVRAAVRGSGAYSNFAFEASGDIGEIYQAYMARFVVRFLF